MSLRPAPAGPIPAETARVARAALPKGHPCLRRRDEWGPIDDDERFAPRFPPQGRPAEAPWRLALVIVLQCAEGLGDRQAADAVRDRLAWQYLLGLELTDTGFDCSMLSDFRARPVAGGAEQLLLAALLDRCKAAGLLKPHGKQRTDSTHVLAAVRAQPRRMRGGAAAPGAQHARGGCAGRKVHPPCGCPACPLGAGVFARAR